MNLFKKYFLFVVFSLSLLFAWQTGVLLAADSAEDAVMSEIPIGVFDELNDCKATGDCNLCNFLTIFTNIARKILSIAGGIALMFFVLAGIIFILSFGNSEKVKSAKNMVINTIIGLVIIITAWTVVNAFFLYLFGKESATKTGEAQVWGKTPWSLLTGFCPVPPRPTSVLVDKESPLDKKTAENLVLSAGIKIKIGADGANLNGIRPVILNEIIGLASICGGSNIVITSGTDGTMHATTGNYNHASGYKVDLRSTNEALNGCIKKGKYAGIRSDGAPVWEIGNAKYAKEGDHWDVVCIKCN